MSNLYEFLAFPNMDKVAVPCDGTPKADAVPSGGTMAVPLEGLEESRRVVLGAVPPNGTQTTDTLTTNTNNKHSTTLSENSLENAEFSHIELSENESIESQERTTEKLSFEERWKLGLA